MWLLICTAPWSIVRCWCVKTEGAVGWRFVCCPCYRNKTGSVSGSSVDEAGFGHADRGVRSRSDMGVSSGAGKQMLTTRPPMGGMTLMQYNMGKAGMVFGLLRKPSGGIKPYVSCYACRCRCSRVVCWHVILQKIP